jgi:hypothetical protein
MSEISVAPLPKAPSKLLQILSFYSPIIIITSVIFLSAGASALGKGIVYLLFVVTVTMVRALAVRKVYTEIQPTIPDICEQGNIFPTSTLSYSTFIITFTLFYFLTPMILIRRTTFINFSILFFFITFLILDILVKSKLQCTLSPQSPGLSLFMDGLAGSIFAVLITGPLYAYPSRSILFINEVNSSNQQCTLPSKQKMKCQVFKNGEVVRDM